MSETAPSPDTLIISLQALAARLGKTPTVIDYHNDPDTNIHPETIIDEYGSWENALEAAGLNPDEMGKKISELDLLDELQRLEQEIDGTVTKEDMNEHGKYSAPIYQDRFGSWNDAKREAMVETVQITESALISELQRLAGELDDIPTAEEMAEYGKYAPVTYHRRFGSWIEALDEAGLLR